MAADLGSFFPFMPIPLNTMLNPRSCPKQLGGVLGEAPRALAPGAERGPKGPPNVPPVTGSERRGESYLPVQKKGAFPAGTTFRSRR